MWRRWRTWHFNMNLIQHRIRANQETMWTGERAARIVRKSGKKILDVRFKFKEHFKEQYTYIHYTSTRASRRRKFPKNKWPIVRRQPVPTVSFPRQAAFFSARDEAKSSHSTLHTALFALQTSNFTLHTSHFTLHTSQSTLHTSHFSLLPSHSKPHTSHFTLHTSHCALRTPNLNFTLHTSHFTFHTSNFSLPTASFTLHTTLHTALNLRATKKH